MICRILEKRGANETVIYTQRVNSRFASHLKAYAKYKGKGVWVYNDTDERLLYAIGSYIGLGKKAYIKKQLERMDR